MLTEAQKKYQQEYKQSKKGRAANMKYWQSEKGKATKEKYRHSKEGRLVQKKTDRKYLLTIRGRIIKYKAQAKRRRNLGFIKIHDNIFPKNVHIHWHHIDDEHVIALPRDVHRKCYAGQDKEKHRILCFQAIKCLYGTSVEDLLN